MAARSTLPALKRNPVRPVTTVPLAVRQQQVQQKFRPVSPPSQPKQRAQAAPYTNPTGGRRKRNWWTECLSQVAKGAKIPGRNSVSPIEISSTFKNYWNAVPGNFRDGKKCEEAINKFNRDSPFGGNVQFNDAPFYYGPTDPQNVDRFYKSSSASARSPASQAVPPRSISQQFQQQQPQFRQAEPSLDDYLADLERELNEMGISPPSSPRLSPRTPSPQMGRRPLPPPPARPQPAFDVYDDLPPPPDFDLTPNYSNFDFRGLPPPPRR